MRILYVSHYFPPETNAPAVRVSGLAKLWAHAGHEVHVLTGFPNHPTGIVHPEYRRALRSGFLREDCDGVSVHRTWIFPAANAGKVKRSINYASFMASAAITGSLRLPRPDVIIATSPQLLCAAAGAILARRFGVPLVMEVRDLWPQSLVAVGAAGKGSPLVRGLERLARRLYVAASHIVTVTAPQRSAIVEFGMPAERVSVIPNGIDDEFLATSDSLPQPQDNGRFVVTYLGTIGMAHHLETLLGAASALKDDPSFQFRIVGEGARRSALEAMAREAGLHNVEFTGERPRSEVPRWIAESGACAVLLRNTEVFRTVVPSKMLEMMAVGRPIVLGVTGEARRLLESAGAGIAIAPESVDDLVAAIKHLRANPAICNSMGERGRQFVRREFHRPALAARYARLLEEVVGSRVPALETSPCPKPETVTEPR